MSEQYRGASKILEKIMRKRDKVTRDVQNESENTRARARAWQVNAEMEIVQRDDAWRIYHPG